MTILPFVVAGWLFAVGIYGLVTSRDMIRLFICLIVVQSSTYLLLLGVGYRAGATAPVYADIGPGTAAVDPVVQALTLTDIVVEATVTALLLAFAIQAHKRFRSLDPEDLTPLEG